MKYITEEELRDLCSVQKFETFTLAEGVKLTPGGRQFLVDRKIPIIMEGEKKARKTASIPNERGETPPCSQEGQGRMTEAPSMDVHFALLEAIFFRQAAELLEGDPVMANQLYDMKCCLESIARGSNENIIAPEPCHGMAGEQLKFPQGECVQIRRDMLFAEHGKEAAALHLLRCELHKLYVDKGQLLTADQKKQLSYLMNRLCQMTHSALGGPCRRNAVE